MKQVARIGKTALEAGFAELRQQVKAGKPIGNPMAIDFGTGVVASWDAIKTSGEASTNAAAAKLRYLKAIKRDAQYSSAGPVFLRAFGMRQAGQEILDVGLEQQRVGIS